jgi:hypothetical protein
MGAKNQAVISTSLAWTVAVAGVFKAVKTTRDL